VKAAFVRRVSKCDHTELSEHYLIVVGCGTPYCEVVETHCLACGAYISECGCHVNDGFSGWPWKRHKKGAS
jgi:hypothetical protein